MASCKSTWIWQNYSYTCNLICSVARDNHIRYYQHNLVKKWLTLNKILRRIDFLCMHECGGCIFCLSCRPNFTNNPTPTTSINQPLPYCVCHSIRADVKLFSNSLLYPTVSNVSNSHGIIHVHHRDICSIFSRSYITSHQVMYSIIRHLALELSHYEVIHGVLIQVR